MRLLFHTTGSWARVASKFCRRLSYHSNTDTVTTHATGSSNSPPYSPFSITNSLVDQSPCSLPRMVNNPASGSAMKTTVTTINGHADKNSRVSDLALKHGPRGSPSALSSLKRFSSIFGRSSSLASSSTSTSGGVSGGTWLNACEYIREIEKVEPALSVLTLSASSEALSLALLSLSETFFRDSVAGQQDIDMGMKSGVRHRASSQDVGIVDRLTAIGWRRMTSRRATTNARIVKPETMIEKIFQSIFSGALERAYCFRVGKIIKIPKNDER